MAKQKSQLYEGIYVLSATLSDEARQKALEKITNGILERGGVEHKIFDQGRKKALEYFQDIAEDGAKAL